MIKLISTFFALALFSNIAYAKTIEIEMLNKDSAGRKMVYSQEFVQVDTGDTVKWIPTSKGHNVQIVAAPDGFDIPKKSKNGKEVSIDFTVPGIYYYWCTPHKGMGMIGLIVVGNDTSNKDDIAKAKALGKSKKKLKELLGKI